jgi:hypothetical protein
MNDSKDREEARKCLLLNCFARKITKIKFDEWCTFYNIIDEDEQVEELVELKFRGYRLEAVLDALVPHEVEVF